MLLAAEELSIECEQTSAQTPLQLDCNLSSAQVFGWLEQTAPVSNSALSAIALLEHAYNLNRQAAFSAVLLNACQFPPAIANL